VSAPDLPARDLRDTDLAAPELRARLVRTWGSGEGLLAWLSTVDHKIVRLRFIVTAFVFLLLAGALAIGACSWRGPRPG
jgi:cytochrome c oxidase subunit 1